MKKLCNAVFEGGGVRGIGLAGAACAFEAAGYSFNRVAGSSAGAIVASLLAAGYTAIEIETEIKKLDYKKFKQKDFIDNFGIPGKMLSIGINFGVYSAAYFENWLAVLLEKKGIKTFADTGCMITGSSGCRERRENAGRLQVTAVDVLEKRLLVLPGDLIDYGLDPKTYEIAKAVRMSMSIPVFYEPYKLKDSDGVEHLIVDGGLLSNYPVWILDSGGALSIPVFGFRFAGDEMYQDKKGKSGTINVLDYIKSIVSTVLDAHDIRCSFRLKGDPERTVQIPVDISVYGKQLRIGATDFDITRLESAALFKNGEAASESFLKAWNFDEWQKKYRTGHL